MAFLRKSKFWLILAISLVVVSLIITFILDYEDLKIYSGFNALGTKRFIDYLDSNYVENTNRETQIFINITDVNPLRENGKANIIVVTRDITYKKSKYLLFSSYVSFEEFSNYGSNSLLPLSGEGYGFEKLSNKDTLSIDQKEIAVFTKEDVNIEVEGPTSLFPFDRYVYYVSEITLVNDEGKIGNEIPFVKITDIGSQNAFMHWNKYIRPSYNPENESYPYIEYYRPVYVITSVLSVVILSLVVSFWTFIRFLRSKENKAETLAISVSLAVSLPAFRQIQVPSEIKFAPLYDIPILIVWSVSVLTIFAYMIRRNEEKQESSNDS